MSCKKEVVMAKENVTLRLNSEKRAVIDAIAASLDRDRSYIINEAVDAYLEVHQWQAEQIRKALAEADKGDFATEKEMAAFFAKWTGHR